MVAAIAIAIAVVAIMVVVIALNVAAVMIAIVVRLDDASGQWHARGKQQRAHYQLGSHGRTSAFFSGGAAAWLPHY
jgi:hypothetical protein